MKKNIQGFSFVELLITLVIIVLLAFVGLNVNQAYKIKSNNSRIIADLSTIENALMAYKQSGKNLPLPAWNKNSYSQSGTFTHNWDSANTFATYGLINEDTIPKQFLDSIPKDQSTNNYFAYAITKPSINKDVADQFEISGIVGSQWEYKSIVSGDYTAKSELYSLIREYNGPDFVNNNSTTSFPYNPDEVTLSAKLHGITGGGVVVNGDPTLTGKSLVSWDSIEVPLGSRAELYFSDGSISILWDPSELTQLTLTDMSYPKEDNLISRISLTLTNGTLWTKATDLNDDGSEFEVTTSDATASVRGTIFWIEKNTAQSQITLIEWTLDVTNQHGQQEEVQVLPWEYPAIFQAEGTSMGRVSGGTITGGNNLPNLETVVPTSKRGEVDLETPAKIAAVADVVTCGGVEMFGECHEDVGNMSLYAYAPYGKKSDGSDNWYLYDTNENPDTFTKTTWWTVNFTDTSIKVTDAPNSFLKYNNIDLSWDFLLKIKVKKNDLERINWSYTLLNFEGSSNIKIIKSFNKVYLWTQYYSWNNLCNNTYCNISIIKKNNTCSLKIDDEIRIINMSCNNIGNSLYVGSNKSAKIQWNWIIESLKIYK